MLMSLLPRGFGTSRATRVDCVPEHLL